MADSSITKRILAQSLKELMLSRPFVKISVGEICSHCSMNRKSFYYHFRDKYDLVNWIFDTEFLQEEKKKTGLSSWHFLLDMCLYMDSNRGFYRRALAIEGQNSLCDHIREQLLPSIRQAMEYDGLEEMAIDFHVQFYSDAFLGALKRWLKSDTPLAPREFVRLLFSCMERGAVHVQRQKSMFG